MDYRLSNARTEIQGMKIQKLLQKCGMGTYTSELHQKAFENSYKFTLIYTKDKNELIGCGRILSDGCYQAAVYGCSH